MKKILLASILLLAYCAKSQMDTTAAESDSVEIKVVDLPESTAIGTSDGKTVSKEIGPLGGTIISDDGRVELIFPEGALASSTVISVQPITNLVPNGSGKAYRLEPSGIRFAKPLEIIFHYTKEEAETCPPELMFLAIQDSKGKWTYGDYEDWNSTANLLKGTITHFSQMVNENLAELVPDHMTLRAGGKDKLTLVIVNPNDDNPVPTSDPGGDDLPALPKIVPLGKENTAWSVNGISRGNRNME